MREVVDDTTSSASRFTTTAPAPPPPPPPALPNSGLVRLYGAEAKPALSGRIKVNLIGMDLPWARMRAGSQGTVSWLMARKRGFLPSSVSVEPSGVGSGMVTSVEGGEEDEEEEDPFIISETILA